MPDRTAELLDEWDLVADGEALSARTARVLPVRTRRGAEAVLKLGSAGPRALEHLALTRWDGAGAVRLLRADPHQNALLLERLAGPDLGEAWDVQACETVGGLYGRLHRPVGAPFQKLSVHLVEVLAGLAALPRSARLPRRLVEQAVALGKDFLTDEGTDGTLIHTDLHYEHVLDGDAGWSVISPAPLSGDPAYEVAPLLWNRFDELAGDVRNGVRRRLHATVDAGVLDEDRARDWVVLRAVARAAAADPEDLTGLIAVAKAVQD